MRLNLVALTLALIGLGMATTSLQSQVLINLTNQVWRYDESGTDPGAFWETLYDDSLWAEGRGVFAFETSTAGALVANVYPYTNTILLQPSTSGRTVAYFRTHFNFPHADPDNYVLVSSNLIDDGFVMYINGQEVTRFNMNPANDDYFVGLAAAANPNGEGVYVFTNRVVIPGGLLVQGDNVLAVRVHQNGAGSSDVVWGHWLHASLAYRPRILSPTAPQTVTVEQGRNHTMSITVDAAPPATIQWQLDGVDIPGAIGNSYTITDMDDTKDGVYRAVASNSAGSSNSPTVTVIYDPDDTAPVFVHASGNPTDPTMITLFFSENIAGNVTEQFNYQIETVPPGGFLGVVTANHGASSNEITLITDPRDPSSTYQVTISFHGLADFFGNPLPDPSSRPLLFPVTFQEGVNGYVGTQDTELESGQPDLNRGADATVTVDNDPVSHDLLRFDNLIGSQIPLGAVVVNATLRMYTVNQAPSAPRFHRMLVPWTEASTWNSMGGGVSANNIEAETAFENITLDVTGAGQFDTINVTAALTAWADGQANHGWVLIHTSTDGWDWATSENGTVDQRPLLTVDFFVPEAPCSIEQDPASITVDEKQPFTLSVVTRGSDLRYQWYRNDVAIPGADAFTYTINRAVPADSGTYHVVVENDIPSLCTSGDAVVVVNADTAPPVLTSALGNVDQTTISLTFNDTLDAASAGNPANYTLDGGLTITGLAFNGSSVTLTSSAPRTVGQNYTLTITGVQDDAVALNLISPNPTVTNLAQQIRLLPFGSTWKYDTNGTDLGTDWKEVGYNDSGWPAGTGLLGLETTLATLDSLFAQGLNTNNAMLWSLTAPDGSPKVTWYLRNSVNIPYDTANATVTLRQVIDDGDVFYFNGTERFRFDMPAGDVTYTTEAVSATGEAVIRTSTLTNIACGDNVIAVSVHNDTPTSTDILFDAELLATFPSFSVCAVGPELSIVNNGDGTVTLSWAPAGGNLQESTDLTNWVPSARTNGGTFTPTGATFYRVAP